MKITTIPFVLGILTTPITYAQTPANNEGAIELPVLAPYSTTLPDEQVAAISVDISNDFLDTDAGAVDIDELLILPGEPASQAYNAGGESPIARLLLNNASSIQWQGLNNRLRSPDDVKLLYQEAGFRPLWTANGTVTALGASVIKASKEAWTHALKPEVYHALATSSLAAGQTVVEPEKFDVILTDAFVTLKKHLANGIVNPKDQFLTWNQRPERFNFYQLYQQAQNAGNVEAVLRVDNVDYAKLRSAYVAEKSGDKPAAKVANIAAKSLKPGQKNQSIVALRAFLGLPTDSNVYDKSVRAAVKDYQLNHGLGADGIAGRKTIARMNGETTTADHTETLAINMERLRWQKPTPEGNYLWVNIPAYRMAIRNGNDFLFESKVIVGRKSRPTPIFSDTLEHVVLAPYWNVPKTIFAEDKLPKLQKNPHALGKNMQVIDKATGKAVNPSSVNWHGGGEGYRLRQLPGARNSLGRMKFLFPNKHAIYLHDTPKRKLFKKTRRAFSSGCVRVERAEDLSVFLLQNIGYNRDRILRESRRKKEKWLTLDENLRYPVFLDYYTAWVDSNGKVRYSQDVYGYDSPLIDLYQRALKNL